MSPNEIQEVLEGFQRQIDDVFESRKTELAASIQMQSRVDALTSIALSLAIREGLSEVRFQTVFLQRTQYFHQRRLENIETVDGNLAAQIEKLAPSHEDPGEELMPLFED